MRTDGACLEIDCGRCPYVITRLSLHGQEKPLGTVVQALLIAAAYLLQRTCSAGLTRGLTSFSSLGNL